MARLSPGGAAASDPTAIDLNRLIQYLHNTFLEPDPDTAHRLRTSHYERDKLKTNIEYAKSLLLRQEQESANIKVQSRKLEFHNDLLTKQRQIETFEEKLQELNDNAQDDDEASTSSGGEDILLLDTPSESHDDHTPSEHAPGSDEDDDDSAYRAILSERIAAAQSPPPPRPTTVREELFPSSLRARNTAHPSQTTNQGISTSSSHSAPAPAMTQMILTHHRTEQEALTTSLLTMAQALKESSKSFATSLESEKETLSRTGEGLERNTSGLEAASRRMGVLRQMSEGKGWWGRMMLYAWIFGLMMLALFIVGFMPKLRF